MHYPFDIVFDERFLFGSLSLSLSLVVFLFVFFCRVTGYDEYRLYLISLVLGA